MVTNKIKASLIAALTTTTAIISCTALSANATVYTNGFTRGARHISYVETDFTWVVDNRYNITDSTATQWEEGFFTYAGGATRTLTDPIEHYWNCKSSIRIGVGKLAYNQTYSDNICLANSGSAWILD